MYCKMYYMWLCILFSVLIEIRLCYIKCIVIVRKKLIYINFDLIYGEINFYKILYILNMICK